PASMDDAAADAVARRGLSAETLDLYFSKLAKSRMTSARAFFRQATWGHPEALPLASSRLIAAADVKGWAGLLAVLKDSGKVPAGELMAVSLGSPSEDLRTESVWYLVRGYALDPARIPEPVKAAVAEPRSERSTDREDFGRELLRRMLGG